MNKIYTFTKRLSKYKLINLQYPIICCFNVKHFHKVKLFFTQHNNP